MTEQTEERAYQHHKLDKETRQKMLRARVKRGYRTKSLKHDTGRADLGLRKFSFEKS